ncbi:MAG: alpha-glucosidase [Gammaproteobacteria bacterium]|nr:alpha-glucosidase [Gammaproteobacteria bacterium]
MSLFKELFNEKFGLTLMVGDATYKMDRGSFKTKDHIKKREVLSFFKEENNVYYYKNKKYEAKVIVKDEGDSFSLSFDVPEGFNRLEYSLNSDESEVIYGTGEQYSHLNLKGTDVKIWLSEHHLVKMFVMKFFREKLFGVNPSYIINHKYHQSYYASPTFMSSKKYFINALTSQYALFSFKKDRTVLSFREIPKEIRGFSAESFKELSHKVSEELGYQNFVPTWTEDGAIISIQSGTENVIKAYNFCKEKGIKLAGIWCQDWSGMIETEFGHQVFWNWECDNKLYHDLKETIDMLHKDGIKFLGYINTFLKRDSAQYKEAKEKGYCVKMQSGEIYHVKSTTFDAAIVDLTNPDAFNWYKEIIKKNMIEFGLDGWMADFGEYLPTDSVVYTNNALEAHNEWPTLWMKCNHDALKECGVEKEVFYFNRASYKTTIPYCQSMWCGDQHVDFSDDYGMGSVIPATLSMAMSGVGFTHSDIGGYTTVIHMKRDAELMKRWAEMNVFTPVFRCHEGNRPWSNVQYDNDEVYDHFRLMSLYYSHLKEYNDYTRCEYYNNGLPINRPLFYEIDDPNTYTIRDEFMYGSDILVAPILRPKEEKRKVYLPKGNWVEFFTNKEYTGGTYEVESKIGKPLAFYKKESKFNNLFKEMGGIK